MNPSCLLKNAVVAFFNLARRKAKLREARKITTYVAILSSHPCEVAACRENQQAAKHQVRLSDVAKQNVDDIYRWIAERSVDGANRWYRNVLDELANDPSRFAEAPESRFFEVTIRNLSFRMRSGRTYRLRFTVVGDEVQILFLRGPGQDWVAP